MQAPILRVPVCLVTGAAGADKNALICALAATRPASERWAILNNDVDELSFAQDAALTVTTVRGCACCTGQIVLQTAIVQLIRQFRPQRLIIAVSGAAEPAALARALQQESLARAIQITHRLCVAAAGQLNACPSATRDLWLRQMHAAGTVLTADEPALRALRATLAGLPETLKMTTLAHLPAMFPTPLTASTVEA